jgi:hypothetical protein
MGISPYLSMAPVGCRSVQLFPFPNGVKKSVIHLKWIMDASCTALPQSWITAAVQDRENYHFTLIDREKHDKWKPLKQGSACRSVNYCKPKGHICDCQQCRQRLVEKFLT